jgi:hypothetical protein
VAKKKVAASPSTTPAALPQRKATSKSGSRQASTAKDTTATSSPQRHLSNQEIGAVAGEVWHHLAEHGPQSVTALKKAAAAPGELVLSAIGWLAREGKLDFNRSGRSVKVSLR